MIKTILKRILVRTDYFESRGHTSCPKISDSLVSELQKLGRNWLNKNLLWLMNFYPPYMGAGIKIDDHDQNFRQIRVKMDLYWWNQNYVGTQFGGSLYSMCDPFYMLMVLDNLGLEYEVWDKSASIRFRKPGRGTVYADFEIDEHDLASIRDEVASDGVSEPIFTVDVVDKEGNTVAEVEKELHVTLKKVKFNQM